MRNPEPQFLSVTTEGESRRIAVLKSPAKDDTKSAPGLLILSGFHSSMRATKASALADWAEEKGIASTRMDYSGHGDSDGEFEEGTISRWLTEAEAVFDTCTEGSQVLVGASMGGWIALLLALAHIEKVGLKQSRIKGLVLIAPATDFTEVLMWNGRFTDDIRAIIETEGRWLLPTDYAPEPYAITKTLIEDGRRHLLLDRTLEFGCPITIVQGRMDQSVPWQHACRLTECLPADDVTMTLVPDGDHRLSRPQDLALILKAVERLVLAP